MAVDVEDDEADDDENEEQNFPKAAFSAGCGRLQRLAVKGAARAARSRRHALKNFLFRAS